MTSSWATAHALAASTSLGNSPEECGPEWQRKSMYTVIQAINSANATDEDEVSKGEEVTDGGVPG